MLDQKYRVRVNRDPLVSTEKSKSRNKRWLIWGGIAGGVLLVTVVILVAIGGRTPDESQETSAAELKLIIDKGDVQIKRADAEDFDEATDGMTVESGTTVRTEEDAVVALELVGEKEASVVRINESSRLEVEEVNAGSLKSTLIGGEAWTFITGDEPAKATLETTEVRVEAQSTTYNVRQGDDATTVMAVTDTSIVTGLESKDEGTTDKGKLFLEEDQQTTVDADNIPESEDDFDTADIGDDVLDSFWFRWNTEKDQELSDRLEGREDDDGPSLEIDAPKDGFETKEDSIEVKGTTDVSATVTINDEEVENDNGNFKEKIDLKEGDNKITIVATDPSDNETKEVINVIRKKAGPTPVSVTLNTDEEGSVLVTWNKSDEEAFGSYTVKRGGEVIERITDQNTTEFMDDGLSAGETYTYSVCVLNEDGQEGCSQDQDATVKGEPNKPPTVSITAPASGTSFTGATPVSFGASGDDPDGEALTYNWDFGDGVQTTGQNVTHTYSVTTSPKTMTVKVTVTDRSGATDESSVTITIKP